MARGISRIGTSRSAIAADIAQKPPSATPSTTRASRSSDSDEAKVASRFETMSNAVSIHITSLRSRRRVMMAIVGAAMAPTTAVAVTACPASPSLTPRSRAIGVSRLAGRNSAVTRPKTPSARDTTAPQAGSVRSSGTAGFSRAPSRVPVTGSAMVSLRSGCSATIGCTAT